MSLYYTRATSQPMDLVCFCFPQRSLGESPESPYFSTHPEFFCFQPDKLSIISFELC